MTPEKYWMDKVASTGCVIHREKYGERVPGSVHHVATGSGKRSDYATACLCYDHHQGVVGVHGMGVKAFCALYKLSSEYDLLVLQNKYIAMDERK